MKLPKKSKTPFKFLWITDPWDTLDHPKDTTLRLAQEALTLGCESYWCDVKSIRWEKNQTLLDSRRIVTLGSALNEAEIQLGPIKTSRPQDFNSLQYRTDPPVDLAYQQPLQLLALALGSAKKSEMVNPISTLLVCNEKLEAGLLFSKAQSLMPPTVVSSQWSILEKFGLQHGKAVLKPLHTAQSKGVELLSWSDSPSIQKAKAAISLQTDQFQRPVALQKYLPGINKGETRLWFLDGKLLAQATKLPLSGDFRVNIDQGSRLAPHVLTRLEKSRALTIGKHLKSMGVRLAAVDLIEGYVTDFNFTSPGLITQIESITGRNLARPIIIALCSKGK